MTPTFLLDEQTVRANSSGPPIDLGDPCPSLLSLTLGITRVAEQQCIELQFRVSADGEAWDDKPVAAVPQKFYCGVYSVIADLSEHPAARFIRAEWKVNRWGRGDLTPLFNIYVFAEPVSAPIAVGATA